MVGSNRQRGVEVPVALNNVMSDNDNEELVKTGKDRTVDDDDVKRDIDDEADGSIGILSLGETTTAVTDAVRLLDATEECDAELLARTHVSLDNVSL